MCYESAVRWIACTGIVLALASCGNGVYFVPGTATLPECTEAPVTNLDGTQWYDNGTVTILTAGCQEAMPDDVFESCALDWVFTQDGNDVTIVVDNEYRIEGRLCGGELYLRGGWWLPVRDNGLCTYEEDSADEVGIQAEGSVLTVAENPMLSDYEMTGTLSVQGSCNALYEVVLNRSPFSPGPAF
ncbi:MAG: hypothetical protein WBM46_06165 [Polyangiales bacterium]|jgi:hypothetical protein